MFQRFGKAKLEVQILVHFATFASSTRPRRTQTHTARFEESKTTQVKKRRYSKSEGEFGFDRLNEQYVRYFSLQPRKKRLVPQSRFMKSMDLLTRFIISRGRCPKRARFFSSIRRVVDVVKPASSFTSQWRETIYLPQVD